jgi:hypothetical protein
MTLTDGIYSGGRAGTVSSGPIDPHRTAALIDDLAGGRRFVVREYVHFLGREPEPALAASIGAGTPLTGLPMPDDWYVQDGRALDLVVSYIPPAADVSGWLEFLHAVIERYGDLVAYLQVTLEPNFPLPLIDGSAPGVLDALVHGVPHARATLDRRGLGDVRVGFSVAESPDWLGGDDAFWEHLSRVPAAAFAEHVDYVGLGLYPDAFSPVAPDGAPGDLASLTAHALDVLRHDRLPRARIGASTPIHIAENGSPSGEPRDGAGQARSIATMIRVVQELAGSHNVTHYELFGLRDAHSAVEQATGTLGITTDRYEPKPAYATYRDIVRC